MHPELRRILDVDVADPSETDLDELVEFLSERYRRVPSARMWPVQALCIAQLKVFKRILAMVRVGGGKTLVGLLAPTVLNARCPLYVCPAFLRPIMARRWVEYNRSWRLRAMEFVSYRNIVMNNAVLQHRDLLIFDEAHRLKNQRTGTYKAVLAHLRRNPDCSVVFMSGSFVSSSVHEYAHLLQLAVGDRSPLPLNQRMLGQWARLLDSEPDREPDHADVVSIAPLRELLDDAERTGDLQADVRAAYRRRLETTPGVVVHQEDEEVHASLQLRLLRIGTTDRIREAIQTIKERAEDPSGDVLVDELAVHGSIGRVSLGFHYRWVWPGGEPDREYLDCKRRWQSLLRVELEHRWRPGYDTPLRVVNTIRRGDCPSGDLVDAYLAWRAVDTEERRPDRETVWVDRTVMMAIGRALLEESDLVVWYRSIAVAEALEAEGLRVYRAGETVPEDPAALASVICLPLSRREGLNLQTRYSRGLVLEMPGSNAVYEQLLGRLHRPSQPADEVVYEGLAPTGWTVKTVHRCIEEARTVFETTGQGQKLLCCDVDEVKW